jgi:hypothetical protein
MPRLHCSPTRSAYDALYLHLLSLRPRHFADSSIPGDNQFTGAQRSFLKIRRIGRQHLPTRNAFLEYSNGSHIGELAPQTLMMRFGGSDPHPIVRSIARLVAQYQNNLLFYVHGETAKHRAGPRRKRRQRAQHELMWNSLALLDGEQIAVWRNCTATASCYRTAAVREPVQWWRQFCARFSASCRSRPDFRTSRSHVIFSIPPDVQ